MYQFCRAVQPKECCVNSGKTASIAVKATVKSRLMITNRATAGFRSTRFDPDNKTPIPRLVKETTGAGAVLGGVEALVVVCIWRVSGRKRSTSRALASATIMATQKGTPAPRGANKPP